MIRAGLARIDTERPAIAPPFHPDAGYPELAALGGDVRTGATNPAYAAVRSALRALGLDSQRASSAEWNPLGDLVAPGGNVVLKPNFIRHWNPLESEGQTVASVITDGAIVRAAADYAFLAVGSEGSVTIAEAPQQDCDFERIRELVGLDELVAHYAQLGLELGVIDLRRETVSFRDGIITERHALPGDPLGYREVDLGSASFFAGSGLDTSRFRGADYDPGPTTAHHSDGRNAYLLSETVLSADLVVNLPKLKTHKKTGVTLAIKNLVGINGDKNWLPHHSVGGAESGGDEFPGRSPLDRVRSWATELARPLLARGRLLGAFRLARRFESSTRGDAFIRAGNWYGNRTTWRMCCDLNRCLYYSDRKGLHLDAPAPVRTVLTILDGIVAGEGEGPLTTRDVPLGAVIAGTDPVAVDLVAVRLMGFDERRIPKIHELMKDEGPRITAVRAQEDVLVGEARVGSAEPQLRDCELASVRGPRTFEAHPGWRGHIEIEPTG